MVTVNKKKYVVREIPASENYFTIISYIPYDEMYRDQHLIRMLSILLNGCAVFIPAFMAMIFHRQIQKPVSAIVQAMHCLEAGNYDIRLNQSLHSEFGYLYSAFNQLSAQLQNLIKDVLEKKLLIQEEQFRQLQAHINPHFLYNSLYIGYRMAKSGDSEQAAQLCMYLGNYFRHITYMPEDNTNLNQEIEFVRTYLLLNKMRFGDRLEFTIQNEVEALDLFVPNLLVQPLVENSLQHGLEKTTRTCRLQLTFQMCDDELYVAVENDQNQLSQEGICMLYRHMESEQSPGKSYGLWNINRRLKGIAPLGKGLCIDLPKPEVFRASFWIPLSKLHAQGAELHG